MRPSIDVVNAPIRENPNRVSAVIPSLCVSYWVFIPGNLKSDMECGVHRHSCARGSALQISARFRRSCPFLDCAVSEAPKKSEEHTRILKIETREEREERERKAG